MENQESCEWESVIPRTIGIQVPRPRIWNTVPGIRNPRRGIQNPRHSRGGGNFLSRTEKKTIIVQDVENLHVDQNRKKVTLVFHH